MFPRRMCMAVCSKLSRSQTKNVVLLISRGFASKKSAYEHGIHRSNAEVLVEKIPPKEVDGTFAICDGGGGALGHPLEYIQLDTVSNKPAVCKYCGLRFVMSHH